MGMQYMGFGIMLSLSVLFLLLDYLIVIRKAYFLISGFNTMNRERQKLVDIGGLAIEMGRFCKWMGLLFGISALLTLLQVKWTLPVAFVVFMFVVGRFIITAQRYDKGALNSDGSYKKSTKVVVGLVLSFLTVITLFLGVMVFQGGRPSKVSVSATGLVIGGIYRTGLEWSEIIGVEMVDQIPSVLIRTNGYALGDTMKGYFRLKGIGKARLYTVNKKGPFIHINSAEEPIYMNMSTPNETKNLFHKIKNGMR